MVAVTERSTFPLVGGREFARWRSAGVPPAIWTGPEPVPPPQLICRMPGPGMRCGAARPDRPYRPLLQRGTCPPASARSLLHGRLGRRGRGPTPNVARPGRPQTSSWVRAALVVNTKASWVRGGASIAPYSASDASTHPRDRGCLTRLLLEHPHSTRGEADHKVLA